MQLRYTPLRSFAAGAQAGLRRPAFGGAGIVVVRSGARWLLGKERRFEKDVGALYAAVITRDGWSRVVHP